MDICSTLLAEVTCLAVRAAEDVEAVEAGGCEEAAEGQKGEHLCRQWPRNQQVLVMVGDRRFREHYSRRYFPGRV